MTKYIPFLNTYLRVLPPVYYDYLFGSIYPIHFCFTQILYRRCHRRIDYFVSVSLHQPMTISICNSQFTMWGGRASNSPSLSGGDAQLPIPPRVVVGFRPTLVSSPVRVYKTGDIGLTCKWSIVIILSHLVSLPPLFVRSNTASVRAGCSPEESRTMEQNNVAPATTTAAVTPIRPSTTPFFVFHDGLVVVPI